MEEADGLGGGEGVVLVGRHVVNVVVGRGLGGVEF